MRAIAQIKLGVGYLNLGKLADAAQTFADVCHQSTRRGRYEIAATAARQKVYTARRQGNLHNAVTICRNALTEIAEPVETAGHPLSAAGVLYVSLGQILLEQGLQEEADRLLTRGLDRIGTVGRLESRVEGCVALARLKQIEGDVA